MRHDFSRKRRWILSTLLFGSLLFRFITIGELKAEVELTNLQVNHEFDVLTVEYQSQPYYPEANNVLLVNFGQADFLVLSSNTAQGLANLQACEVLALKAMGEKKLSFVVEVKYLNVEANEASNRSLTSTRPVHVNLQNNSTILPSSLRCYLKAKLSSGDDQANNADNDGESRETDNPIAQIGGTGSNGAEETGSGGSCSLMKAGMAPPPNALGATIVLGYLGLFLTHRKG